MKKTEMEAILFCVHCNDETPHIITYINSKIISVKCEECNKVSEVKVDILKEFFKEMYERLLTKPSRITQEYKEDLNKFLKHLPIRLASKPYRLLRDLNQSRKIIKNFKH
ncbi:MAG: bh protein [Bacillota bacterium]|nr:bh protein [Bacillota bacterium]